MSILYLIIPISVCLALGFLAAFIWAVKSGQYDDTDTPAIRVLFDSKNDIDNATNDIDNPTLDNIDSAASKDT